MGTTLPADVWNSGCRLLDVAAWGWISWQCWVFSGSRGRAESSARAERGLVVCADLSLMQVVLTFLVLVVLWQGLLWLDG
jgi:hypothetical protein